jgi:hypothetical protein
MLAEFEVQPKQPEKRIRKMKVNIAGSLRKNTGFLLVWNLGKIDWRSTYG